MHEIQDEKKEIVREKQQRQAQHQQKLYSGLRMQWSFRLVDSVCCYFTFYLCKHEGKKTTLCAIPTASHSMVIVFRITPLDHDLYASFFFAHISAYIRWCIFSHVQFYTLILALIVNFFIRESESSKSLADGTGKPNKYNGAVFLFRKLDNPIVVGWLVSISIPAIKLTWLWYDSFWWDNAIQSIIENCLSHTE